MSFCLSSSLHPFGPVPGSVRSEIQKPRDQGESTHSYLILESCGKETFLVSYSLTHDLVQAWRGVRLADGRLWPPVDTGWNNSIFVTVLPKAVESEYLILLDVPNLPLTQSPTQMTLSTRENRTRQEATPTS